MNSKVATFIKYIQEEGGNYRVKLTQEFTDTSIILDVSMLLSKKTLGRLSASICDYSVSPSSSIDLFIEDPKHFTITFPCIGCFPYRTFGYVDYPFEAIVRKIYLSRAKGISSIHVFSIIDGENCFSEEYFISDSCLSHLMTATGLKDYADLEGCRLIVDSDGLCYFKSHLRAMEIVIEAKFNRENTMKKEIKSEPKFRRTPKI